MCPKWYVFSIGQEQSAFMCANCHLNTTGNHGGHASNALLADLIRKSVSHHVDTTEGCNIRGRRPLGINCVYSAETPLQELGVPSNSTAGSESILIRCTPCTLPHVAEE